jgi:S1-C subfamily serine protease
MSLLEQLSGELQGLAARTAPAVVHIVQRRGQGSGVVLAQDGYVLTNAHVAEGGRNPRVLFPSGGESEARLVGTDAHTDLAVLRVEGSRLSTLPLAERERIAVGQLVLAIGNPLHFDRSVSLGVISALDRSLPTPNGHLFEGLIQTDAAINPGNSGGPLVTMDGAVAGINTAIVPFAQGIGFAVPSHTASWVAAVLIQKGEVARPWLGVSARGVELDADSRRAFGQPRAVLLHEVGSGTPAERAGLRAGDLLLRAAGQPLASIDDLQRVMVLGEVSEIELELSPEDGSGERERRTVRPGPPRKAA